MVKNKILVRVVNERCIRIVGATLIEALEAFEDLHGVVRTPQVKLEFSPYGDEHPDWFEIHINEYLIAPKVIERLAFEIRDELTEYFD